MRRPVALTIVAWLFIASGLWGAASTIGALWIEHRVNLAVDVLGLCVGPGLLHRDSRYYRWAIRLLVLSMVLSVAALVLIGLQPAWLPVRAFGRPLGSVPRIAVVGAALALLGLTIWQYVVLRRADIRALFEAPEANAGARAPSA